ncbi:RecQ family ATP-dependent DNA helicase [Sediminibacterium sp. TEGAF015]|uniref:RecQ family ATP-dependent DNA helicase n=1 Tax=Sediminibacterium sp. TEGAF015 TaxID=575378 RepID=UPI00222E2B03|nr:RecQ family ATP-dependent DNA helicase [Sediminibacterium sp. TEGAF015]
MSNAISILHQYWKHTAFRPLQEEIIHSVVSGKDTLALLPTGGGKSVCYQIPGLLRGGTSLVISPLIALMKDQVDALNKKGIKAAAIHSGLQKDEVKNILQDAVEGSYQFLYCSPERLESHLFNEFLSLIPIQLLVVDEAHCISQWGYDFRPAYCRIAATKEKLPGVPVIAVTASATPLVLEDIQHQLKLKEAAVFKQSFLRPNISYSAFNSESKINKILEIIDKIPGSGIVYCNNRRQCKKIAEAIVLQGIAADFYHAGLEQLVREQKQQNWINNKIRIMVCTNAFGMGIDKPDVRTVIHHDIPECLENYYQEAGRAGRDEQRAYAVLLWQEKDLTALMEQVEIKFPPIPVIQQVYQAIADFLQIPVGSGEGIYYNFDFETFTKRFSLEPLLVVNVLRILEQEGHIQFNEQIFLPTQVSFTTDTQYLAQFEEMYPAMEPVIKALLRTYPGIFNNRVSVYDQQLARICRMNLDQIQAALKQLQALGIIEYLPKKETPQIHFLLNRAPAKYLHIQQEQYLERKKLHASRVNQMIAYSKENQKCRSQFIGHYFGDATAKACGVCDICLRQKNKNISEKEFNTIALAIQKNKDQIIAIADLLKVCRNMNPTRIWEILNFLQSESKIEISEEKIIRWLK